MPRARRTPLVCKYGWLDLGRSRGHLAAVGVPFLPLVAVHRVLRARGWFATPPEPELLQWLDLVALRYAVRLSGMTQLALTKLDVLSGLDRVRLFGAPYLPIPATPLPLPVRFHVWYGEPIDVASRFDPSDSDRPDVVDALVREVRERVAERIAAGRAARAGWFR